jgi:signal transduction histidine kinase
MVNEVEEMEAMIASVLDFLRGASVHGVREIADLGSIVSEVVSQNPRAVGEVVILESWSAPVEVDRLGIRRVVANLLENAIKYGDRAKLRVRADNSHALVEVIDSPHERERSSGIWRGPRPVPDFEASLESELR